MASVRVKFRPSSNTTDDVYCEAPIGSVAKSKNIPLSVISEGMGHDSEETTRIYLASLDSDVIDKANSLILKGL